MTNAIDRRIARIEAHLEPAKRRILFANNAEEAERCRRENPEALIVSWLWSEPPEQRP